MDGDALTHKVYSNNGAWGQCWFKPLDYNLRLVKFRYLIYKKNGSYGKGRVYLKRNERPIFSFQSL